MGAATLLATFLGFWLVRDILTSVQRDKADRDSRRRPGPFVQFDAPNLASKAPKRHGSRRAPRLDEILFGLPGERIVRFENEEDYRNFLAKLSGSKARLLGRLDKLRAVRIGFDNLDDLDGLLDEDDSF
ncbi:MAG: hypothetical protein QGG01_07390, partial [Roseibacillus sp.]|nr:hypothetical protein [Roseibacillus sp.]